MSKMGASPGLLDLPEEVICEILRLLDATSLYLLSRTCTHLDDIIKNNLTLWRCIDARRAPNNVEKINYCLERCYDDGNTWTHTLLIRGDNNKEILMPHTFLPKISTFTNLAILACENQNINGKKYDAMTFPPQLQEFSLRRTVVTSPLKFFKGSGQHFKKLRVLILDECDWLTSAAFMPIAKYSSLEILSVYKCENVENSIAYLSMAGQGFKSLKVFDARLSPLGNTLVRAIYRLQSLLAIYLQNRGISYKLDYYRRKLEIVDGVRSRGVYNEDEEFDMEEEEEEPRLHCEDNEMLDDNGLIDYLTVPSSNNKKQLPQSVLYLDPYNACTCGFEESQRKKAHGSPNGKDDDDDDDKGDNPHKKMLLSRIAQLTHVIELCQSSNYTMGLSNANHPLNRIDTLKSFLQSEAATAMGDVHVCLNIAVNPQATNRIIYGSIGCDDSDEPPRKRLRTEDPIPGPSGLHHSSDSETEDARAPGPRPPTPHPDVAIDGPESVVYKIAFEDAAIVQIEDIGDINKDTKVSLRRLSLRGYKKITNTTLRYIGDLDLDLLDLTYTGVTYEGIQKYLESHPLCRVVHERFCTCLPNLNF